MKYTEEIADINYALEQMQREIIRLEQENEALKEKIKELEEKE